MINLGMDYLREKEYNVIAFRDPAMFVDLSSDGTYSR